MKPAGICFDATGTLIERTASVGTVYSEIAARFGVELPAWRLDDAFTRVLRHAPERGVGASPGERRQHEIDWWSERIRETFQATDSTVRFEDFVSFAEALFETYRGPARWRLRPGVRAALARLARNGHPMAVVSNFDHRLPQILQAIEIEHYFLSISIPSTSGFRKPARKIFEGVAEALDRSIESLVYVGDDAPETLSAIAAHGLRTIEVAALASFEVLPEWVASPATLPSRTAR
jgi:putative hydrolase of the HAD superfamily